MPKSGCRNALSSSHAMNTWLGAVLEPVEIEVVHPVVAVEAVVLGDEVLAGDVAHERRQVEPRPDRLLEAALTTVSLTSRTSSSIGPQISDSAWLSLVLMSKRAL